MTIEDKITWPESWVWETEPNSTTKRYSVHIECSDYGIYQSGGNETLWYVVQYWIGTPEEHDTDISGPHGTLQRAIDSLRLYLAGKSVPSGDVITVFLDGCEIGTDEPIYHDHNGNLSVYLGIPEDRA